MSEKTDITRDFVLISPAEEERLERLEKLLERMTINELRIATRMAEQEFHRRSKNPSNRNRYR